MVNFPKPLAEYDVQDLVPVSVCDMFTVWLSITHPLFWIVSPTRRRLPATPGVLWD